MNSIVLTCRKCTAHIHTNTCTFKNISYQKQILIKTKRLIMCVRVLAELFMQWHTTLSTHEQTLLVYTTVPDAVCVFSNVISEALNELTNVSACVQLDHSI